MGMRKNISGDNYVSHLESPRDPGNDIGITPSSVDDFWRQIRIIYSSPRNSLYAYVLWRQEILSITISYLFSGHVCWAGQSLQQQGEETYERNEIFW